MKLTYDISLAKNNLKIPLTIAIKNTQLTIRTGSINDVDINLSPTGGAVEWLMSTTLKPFADNFKDDQAGIIRDTISFAEISLMSILPINISDMIITVDSIDQGGHVVEGEDFVKLVPKFSLTPSPALFPIARRVS